MNHPAGAVDVVYGNWPLRKWSESSYSRIWKRCYKDRLGRGVVGPGEYGPVSGPSANIVIPDCITSARLTKVCPEAVEVSSWALCK
jgi:hypothetical protein